MTPLVKKILLGLHFPAFFILLIYVSIEFILIPDAWVGDVTSLSISVLENETVLFLSKFMFIQILQNFLLIGILVSIFTIISMNAKKFIINAIILYFFINFLFLYLCFRFSSNLLNSYAFQFFLSIILTCILFLLWSFVPYVVMKKIKARRLKNKAPSIGVNIEAVTCKNCGEKYLSNPVYCVKCLSKIEP